MSFHTTPGLKLWGFHCRALTSQRSSSLSSSPRCTNTISNCLFQGLGIYPLLENITAKLKKKKLRGVHKTSQHAQSFRTIIPNKLEKSAAVMGVSLAELSPGKWKCVFPYLYTVIRSSQMDPRFLPASFWPCLCLKQPQHLFFRLKTVSPFYIRFCSSVR